MNDVPGVRQFRPALLALVTLGATGFCLATGNAALWVLVVAAIAANARLRRDGAWGLPRWGANALTLVAGGWAVWRVAGGALPVEPIGLFLVVLQVVKLYEQRAATADRDAGQLIVLSLLTVVAAAMTQGGTALWFGGLLVAWALLAVHTALLYQLKGESDAARRAAGDAGPGRRAAPAFARAARRLSGAVAVGAMACALGVFVAFPRGAGSEFLGEARMAPGEAVTGFDGRVGFQQIARIRQDDTPQAYVAVERGGRAVTGETLYLRGATLDYYDSDPDGGGRWTWRRSRAVEATREVMPFYPQRFTPLLGLGAGGTGAVAQRVQLEPTGSEALFALAGSTGLRMGDPQPYNAGLSHLAADGTTARADRPVRRRVEYEVRGTGELPAALHPAYRARAEAMRQLTRAAVVAGEPPAPAGAASDPDLGPVRPADPAIVAFATDPDVSGRDADGEPLASARLRAEGPSELDAIIAGNVEAHLRDTYRYSLDVSRAAAALPAEADPLGWFVSEAGREGHCEFFAGAMALSLQSLGVPARVAVGFKSSDFNPSIGRYTVRRSDAHAWVEAHVGGRWRRYDPTAGTPADAERHGPDPEGLAGLGRRLRRLSDSVRYAWANHVIGYDTRRQADLGGAGGALTRRINETLNARVGVDRTRADADDGGGWLRRNTLGRLDRLGEWLAAQGVHGLTAAAAAALLVALPLAAVGLTAFYLLRRWRLTRRARRIGLDDLPPDEARRLARHLGFYDEFVRRLARRGILRRPGQTPREFAAGLAHLPPASYAAAGRLTETFYRARFGRRPPTQAERERARGDLTAVIG